MTAFLLDLECFFDGADEVFVDLVQCLDIDDATFVFLCDFDAVLLEHLGVLEQELIRHIADGFLRLEDFLLVRKAEGDDDLALPERDGVVEGALDALGEHAVVVLDQADLRRGLDGDGLAELEVVDFLFKAVDGIAEIAYDLHGHRIIGCLCLLLELRQIFGAHLFDFFFARADVELERFEVNEILVIELVEHVDVAQHEVFCFVELDGDFLNLHGERVVRLHEVAAFVHELAENGNFREAARIRAIDIKRADFAEQIPQEVANIAAVTALDGAEDAI